MGKLKGKHIIGAVGPVILKVVDGETRVSSKPAKGTMKQTFATKQAFNTFGMAASLGKSIRESLVYQTNGFSDFHLPGRLVSLLAETLVDCRDKKSRLYQFEGNTFSMLEGLEFNVKSPLNKSLSNEPFARINGEVMKVTIPQNLVKKELRFPAKMFHCKITVSLSIFRLEDGFSLLNPIKQELVISADEAGLAAQELIFNIPAGCLCIATVFVQFSKHKDEGGITFNSKTFNPGKVIKTVFTPGIFAQKEDLDWITMQEFKTTAVSAEVKQVKFCNHSFYKSA